MSLNVLILDQTGSALDFAMRCMRHGHVVKTCMAYDKKTGQRRAIGDGLIDKIEREEWQKWRVWADIILTTDNVKWLHELDSLKRQGFPVFAPSYESADLELHRGKGQALMKKCGLDVMPYESFSDYKKAEDFVRKTMGRFVSKPDGDVDKALSYVSKSPRDMIYTLQKWGKQHKNQGRHFMLQEFVPGIEMSVNGWMGPKGFAEYVEIEVEYKKLMSGNYGPNTGQTGGVIKYVKSSECPLAKELLLPLERDLLKLGHTGSVDVSSIIDESGSPRPLEFTSRPGWPSFNVVQCLHPEPVQWMVNLLDGNDTFEPSTDFAVGLVMAIPPFPYENADDKEARVVPVYNLNDANPYRPQLSPCELMSGTAPDEVNGQIVESKKMVSCGAYLVVATGLGDTVKSAAKNAYEVAESLEIPSNLILRDDIGESLQKDLPVLHDYGFALDWNYA